MNLFKWIVDHPIGVLMVFLGAAVFGWVSYARLPLDLMPDISYPTLTVRTEMAGAAPEEVETQVSRPLEESLSTLPGLVELESRSRAEVCDVVLEFDWGTDMDRAAQDVRERLQVTWLPKEAERPLILRYDPSLDPILRVVLSMTAPQEGAPPQDDTTRMLQLRDLGDREVKPVLEAMEGVAAVRIRGGLEHQVLVEVREDWLQARGVTLTQVRNALVAQNVNLSGGSIKDGDSEYLIRTLNEFRTLQEVRDIEVVRADGVRVPVRDLAQVREGWKDREVVTRLEGQEAVVLEVYREADANIVQVARDVKERLGLDRPRPEEGKEKEEKKEKSGAKEKKGGEQEAPPTLLETLPESVHLKVLDDQAAFVEQALANVRESALLGGLLAVVVLFLFLRDWPSTAIIALSIPTSVIVTFAPMYLGGVSLNLMSLGGLALGVGMLVDSSVVVLESIQVYRERGLARYEAAAAGTTDVAAAVVASNLTTVAVFLPIVFVEGVAGQIFGDLSLTVCFSLLASMVVALVVVPVLAARSLQVPPALSLLDYAPGFHLPSWSLLETSWRGVAGWRRILRVWYLVRFVVGYVLDLAGGVLLLALGLLGRLALWSGRHVLGPLSRASLWAAGRFGSRYDRFARTYERWLDVVLVRPGATLGVAVLTLCVSLALLPTLGTELLPDVHQGRFTVEAALPVGTPLERTVAVMARAETLLSALPQVASVTSTIGSERRADSRPDEGEHTARLLVELEPGGDLEAREARAMEQARQVLQDLPHLEVLLSRPALFSFRTPIEVVVAGQDLGSLRDLSDQVVAALQGEPGLRDVKSSLVQGFPEVRIRYDRDQLHRFGLDPATVAGLVRDKVMGADARELARGERRIDMIVRLDERDRRTLDEVARLNINPGLIPPIPLSSVATLSEGVGPSEVRRINQKRVAVITANVEGFDLGGAGQVIRQAMAPIPFPADTTWTLAGQSQEMRASLASMNFAFLLAVFLVYLVMAMTFESLLHPVLIMGALPLSVVGVVLVLLPSGTPMSVMVLIGFIVLAGVVVNNAIVLVDAVNRRIRYDGLSRGEALRTSGRTRLRPILITTGTTVLGLLPLALGLGAGAELQQPMALTIIGGLTSSTALTLLVIPVVYDRVSGWMERWWKGEATPP